jgi:hypothetical protein
MTRPGSGFFLLNQKPEGAMLSPADDFIGFVLILLIKKLAKCLF